MTMRLTFVISSLRSGGAERVLSILSSEFVNDGAQVTIISLADDEPFYKFHPAIKIVLLGASAPSKGVWHAIKQNWARIAALRSAITKSDPEVVISFLDRVNVLTLFATLGLHLPVIVSERTVPGVRDIGRAWELLRKVSYRFAGRVIVQSEDAARFFSPNWPQTRLPVRIIPNPVLPLTPSAISPVRDPYIVSVGRFGEEKRFELMIRAFAEAFPARTSEAGSIKPPPDLVLVGDGPLRERLGQLASELNLGARVRFTGRTTTPEDYVAGAQFYLCASRVEGFPMAVCEALALGVPVIATNCPGAIREIVKSNENGFCVSDDSFIKSMQEFYDRDDRARFSQNAQQIVEKFSLKKVKAMWDRELQALITKE